MKKVLAVVIAVAFISIGAVSSDAQVPNIQIYFDANLTATQGTCQGTLVPQVLYVVCQNFNTLFSTVEFAVDMGANWPLAWTGDVHNAGALSLGQSYVDGPGGFADGVTITYPIPGNGFFPFIAMRIDALWLCDECDPLGSMFQPITVVQHEATGNLEFIEFNTFAVYPVIGMNALVCPGTISTEETSWGRVKALYNN